MINCIITGGNSGIGFQAALQLAEKGHHVTLICRNESRAKQACQNISLQSNNKNVEYLIADLSKMNDIREAVKQYKSKGITLDVLINNAADFDLSVKEPVFTEDGLEKQFATNVVAPYLLTKLFLADLKNSTRGKIINISSQGL